MRHSSSSQPYPLSNYDDQLCLKPPLLLWLAVLYLSRAITLPAVMAIGSFSGVDSKAISLFRGLWSLDALVPSLIAGVMLYALCRRVPSASGAVRWIWSRGRALLAISAALDIVLHLIAPLKEMEIDDQTLLSIFAAVIDLFFLLYLLLARRIRDTFSEFPPSLDSNPK
jgi:hypothetical protein